VRAFIKEGRGIKPQGGSSGGGSQNVNSQSTSYQTNIPEYAKPYAESMLGQGQALTDINQNPYQAYSGQRFEGFSPMQQQAFQNIQGQQVAPQVGAATGIAQQGAQQGLGAQQTASGLQQNALQYGGLGAQYGALGAMNAPQAQAYGANAANIGQQGVQQAQQGFGAGAAYAQQATDPNSLQAYMSPYMQNVVDTQQREAGRQSEIQRQQIQGQAAQQGAFGGSRSAIVEAERQRNLATQMGDIQAQGLQSAFQNAQQAQQFGANLGLQGLQAGYQGLQTGIQGQQAGLQGIQTGLEATGQGIAGAQTGLQGVGQATGAGQYGLQGSQIGIQGAGQLGALGEQQFGQQMSITDAMQKYGALQQQQGQQQKDFDYQQFLAQQQYPYQQLSFMSDLLRGTPSAQSSVYQTSATAAPSTAAQLAGAGIAAYGAFGRKAGGQIKSYADGGQVSPDAMTTMAVQELPSRLKRLSDTQLAAYARSVKDAITLSAINTEMTRRARVRTPGQEAPQDTTAEAIAKQAEAASIGTPRVSMAGGGIVALQAGGSPLDLMNQYAQVPQRPAIPYGDRLRQQVAQQVAPRTPGILIEERDAQGYAPAVPRVVTTTQDPHLVVPPTDQNEIAGYTPPVAPAPAPQTTTAPPQGQTPPAPAPASGSGGHSRPLLPPTFEAFAASMPGKMELPPESQSILGDMQQRVAAKMERADKKSDTAVFDALLMGGLAMMSGTSLADGIARAANIAGPTYLGSKKEAENMMDKAEDADMAFRQYEMALRSGERDRADSMFMKYQDNMMKMYEIDQRAAAAAAKGGAGGVDVGDLTKLVGMANNPVLKARVDAAMKMELPEEQAAELGQIAADYNMSLGAIGKAFNIPLDFAMARSAAPAEGNWSAELE
jgi:hypothetical protein